jgi:hypothetical protein
LAPAGAREAGLDFLAVNHSTNLGLLLPAVNHGTYLPLVRFLPELIIDIFDLLTTERRRLRSRALDGNLLPGLLLIGAIFNDNIYRRLLVGILAASDRDPGD